MKKNNLFKNSLKIVSAALILIIIFNIGFVIGANYDSPENIIGHNIDEIYTYYDLDLIESIHGVSKQMMQNFGFEEGYQTLDDVHPDGIIDLAKQADSCSSVFLCSESLACFVSNNSDMMTGDNHAKDLSPEGLWCGYSAGGGIGCSVHDINHELETRDPASAIEQLACPSGYEQKELWDVSEGSEMGIYFICVRKADVSPF